MDRSIRRVSRAQSALVRVGNLSATRHWSFVEFAAYQLRASLHPSFAFRLLRTRLIDATPKPHLSWCTLLEETHIERWPTLCVQGCSKSCQTNLGVYSWPHQSSTQRQIDETLIALLSGRYKLFSTTLIYSTSRDTLPPLIRTRS